MPDYKQKVKDKETEQSELISRYKVDSGLLYLDKYIMMGPDGKHEVPDVINVTLSIPGRYANDVISTLGTAKEQSIIESEDENLDTTEIEEFRKAAFASADAKLRLQGGWELNPWLDFHSCIRGGGAARCIFQIADGVLDSDIAPWDIRYVTSETGVNGLAWGAYRIGETKDKINALFGGELDRFRMSVTARKAELLDVWDTEHNEIWVDGKKILEQEHSFGFTPVVIQKVVLGSMLADEGSLSHQGESIFFLIREAVPELNRLLSIMQTLNFTTLKPPAGWASKGGQGAKPPKYDKAMSPGSMTAHDIGGGVTEIKFGDAQRSAQLAYSIMREGIQEATAAASGLADIESPPASGVRALISGERGDQLLSPRLGLKALMKQDLADMFTAQVILIGGSIKLGTLRHKRTFQTSKLDGQYEGYYKYTIKSAAVDAGRASLAAGYGNLIPDRAKRVEILQREDPDGDERQLNWEEAGRMSRGVKINRIINDLMEMAKRGDKNAEFEAELLSAEMGINLKQMLAGEVSPLPKEDEPTQTSVLPIFEGSRGRQPTVPEEEE